MRILNSQKSLLYCHFTTAYHLLQLLQVMLLVDIPTLLLLYYSSPFTKVVASNANGKKILKSWLPDKLTVGIVDWADV